MELSQLESFLEVARSGSFRRAARALYLSQASLSARIKALEQDLGAPLFHRTAGGVRLTRMGEALMPHAERAIGVVAEGRSAVNAAARSGVGALSIAATNTICACILPKVLQQFRLRYPSVTVRLSTGSSSILNPGKTPSDVVHQSVAAGDVDLGLALYSQKEFAMVRRDPEILAVSLSQEEVVLVTHPQHPLALLGRATAADIARETLVGYNLKDAPVTEAFHAAGAKLNVMMDLDSLEATKEMVALGLGVSFLLKRSVMHEVDDGRLATVPLPERQRISLLVCVLLRSAQHHTPAIRNFMQLLARMFNVAGLTHPNGGNRMRPVSPIFEALGAKHGEHAGQARLGRSRASGPSRY